LREITELQVEIRAVVIQHNSDLNSQQISCVIAKQPNFTRKKHSIKLNVISNG